MRKFSPPSFLTTRLALLRRCHSGALERFIRAHEDSLRALMTGANGSLFSSMFQLDARGTVTGSLVPAQSVWADSEEKLKKHATVELAENWLKLHFPHAVLHTSSTQGVNSVSGEGIFTVFASIQQPESSGSADSWREVSCGECVGQRFHETLCEALVEAFSDAGIDPPPTLLNSQGATQEAVEFVDYGTTLRNSVAGRLWKALDDAALMRNGTVRVHIRQGEGRTPHTVFPAVDDSCQFPIALECFLDTGTETVLSAQTISCQAELSSIPTLYLRLLEAALAALSPNTAHQLIEQLSPRCNPCLLSWKTKSSIKKVFVKAARFFIGSEHFFFGLNAQDAHWTMQYELFLGIPTISPLQQPELHAATGEAMNGALSVKLQNVLYFKLVPGISPRRKEARNVAFAQFLAGYANMGHRNLPYGEEFAAQLPPTIFVDDTVATTAPPAMSNANFRPPFERGLLTQLRWLIQREGIEMRIEERRMVSQLANGTTMIVWETTVLLREPQDVAKSLDDQLLDSFSEGNVEAGSSQVQQGDFAVEVRMRDTKKSRCEQKALALVIKRRFAQIAADVVQRCEREGLLDPCDVPAEVIERLDCSGHKHHTETRNAQTETKPQASDLKSPMRVSEGISQNKLKGCNLPFRPSLLSVARRAVAEAVEECNVMKELISMDSFTNTTIHECNCTETGCAQLFIGDTPNHRFLLFTHKSSEVASAHLSIAAFELYQSFLSTVFDDQSITQRVSEAARTIAIESLSYAALPSLGQVAKATCAENLLHLLGKTYDAQEQGPSANELLCTPDIISELFMRIFGLRLEFHIICSNSEVTCSVRCTTALMKESELLGPSCSFSSEAAAVRDACAKLVNKHFGTSIVLEQCEPPAAFNPNREEKERQPVVREALTDDFFVKFSLSAFKARSVADSIHKVLTLSCDEVEFYFRFYPHDGLFDAVVALTPQHNLEVESLSFGLSPEEHEAERRSSAAIGAHGGEGIVLTVVSPKRWDSVFAALEDLWDTLDGTTPSLDVGRMVSLDMQRRIRAARALFRTPEIHQQTTVHTLLPQVTRNLFGVDIVLDSNITPRTTSWVSEALLEIHTEESHAGGPDTPFLDDVPPPTPLLHPKPRPAYLVLHRGEGQSKKESLQAVLVPLLRNELLSRQMSPKSAVWRSERFAVPQGVSSKPVLRIAPLRR